MLRFQKSAVEALRRSEACLCVLGRGLGLHPVLLEAVRQSVQDQCLVLVVNTLPAEHDALNDHVAGDPRWTAEHRFVIVEPEATTEERAAHYSRGGAIVVSARLLVPDFLTGRVPAVAGIFVSNAHSVTEFSAEAFVLRIFRKRGKGFIRAVSDRPSLFGRQVQKIMHRCFTNTLDVWPRIRSEVQACLQSSTPEVRQRTIRLSEPLQEIQRLLLKLTDAMLQELRSQNVDLADLAHDAKFVEAEDLRQLKILGDTDPVLQRKVSDLSCVQQLLTASLRYDAVAFHSLLEILREDNAAWLACAEARSLLAVAKARVFEVGRESLTRKTEPHAKWVVLQEILQQTAAEAFEPAARVAPSVLDSDSDIEIVSAPKRVKTEIAELVPRMLVLVPDEKTRSQVASVLSRGIQITLLETLHAHLVQRARCTRSRGGQGHADAHEAALVSRESTLVAKELSVAKPSDGASCSLPDGRTCRCEVDVVTLDGEDPSHQLMEMKPHAVVLFEPCLEGVRAVEMFCAELGRIRENDRVEGNGLGPQCTEDVAPLLPKVHLLMFQESKEKCAFQQALSRESRAVDGLIHARHHHTVRLDSGLDVDASHCEERSSRRGGGRSVDQVLKVVVDMREFRSALPLTLYQHDLVIEPVTIPVGDYVLSRDISVERKAIPDLVQSLSSGRLYHQALGLCKFYDCPALLIEADSKKGFSFHASYASGRATSVADRDVRDKLVLVVIHFPKLRIIWSTSQGFTADMFIRLKEGRHQPDASTATQMGSDDIAADDEVSGGLQRKPKRNAVAFDMLRRLPGVTLGNVNALARLAGTFAGVAQLSEDSLAEVLGRSNARDLHGFLHRE